MSDDASPTVLALLAQALVNIAEGRWNSGREAADWMTAREYAALILHDAGLYVGKAEDG